METLVPPSVEAATSPKKGKGKLAKGKDGDRTGKGKNGKGNTGKGKIGGGKDGDDGKGKRPVVTAVAWGWCECISNPPATKKVMRPASVGRTVDVCQSDLPKSARFDGIKGTRDDDFTKRVEGTHVIA